ncbi:hypothetical protein D3C76_1050560 [compost metagenome]
MQIQLVNPGLMRLGIQTQHQIVPGQLIHTLIRLQIAVNPRGQFLFVLDTQQDAVVTPQHFQLRDTQETEHRPGFFPQGAVERPQVGDMHHRIEKCQSSGANIDRPLTRRQHRHVNHHEGKDQIAGGGDGELNVIALRPGDVAVKKVN